MVGRVTPNSTGLPTEERAEAVHPEGESGTDGADTGQDGVLGSPSDGTGLQPQGRIHVMTCIRMHVITSLFG